MSVVARLSSRPTPAAAVIYAVLALAMFVPGMLPDRTLSASDMLWSATPWDASRPPGVEPLGSNHDQADAVQVFQPFLETTRATLPDVPLWNPYLMGGRPYLADMQSAVFSPFNVPAYVLPLWRSLAFVAALKLFVAAFGMFLLACALGMRFPGALMAGIVFGFSLWMVTWVSWPTVSVWAYLPWLCLLADILLRRPGPLPFAGLAGVVALQFFGGHPESSFHVLLGGSLFWAMRLLMLRPDGARAVARRALLFAGALFAGAALAALVLVPFLELLARSADLDARGYLGTSHQQPRYLLSVFLHDFWGRQTRTTLVFPAAMEERAYYLGALPLMLAAGALILRPSRERLAIGAVGLGALAVATGIPPLFDLIAELPAFNSSHNSRLAILFVFASALLAGWGLDDLADSAWRGARAAVLLATGLVLLALPVLIMAFDGTLVVSRLDSALRIAWGFAHPDRSLALGTLADDIRLSALLEWLPFAAAAVLLLGLRVHGRLGAVAFAALAIGLVVLDLFKAGMGWNPAIPIANAEQPATPATRLLESKTPQRFAGLDSVTRQTLPTPLPPDLSMRYSLLDARGYDYPVERRYERLWHRYIATSPGCLYAFCPQSADRRPEALRALGLFGVTHLLQNPEDPPLRSGGSRVVYSAADGRVVTNPFALPRAFLVNRQELAATDAGALETVVAPDFRGRSVAVTQEPLPGLEPAAATGAKPAWAPAGRTRVVEYEAERVIVDTTARTDSLLVLTDNFFPGWQAEVDGRATDVHRVEFLLRGVSVPPGRHRVEFRYEPLSWRVGWIISVATLAGLLLAVLTRGSSRWTRA